MVRVSPPTMRVVSERSALTTLSSRDRKMKVMSFKTDLAISFWCVNCLKPLHRE